MTDAEVQALRATHAHRFPQTASLTVPGDRGAQVRLSLVVGNPTGACKMPPGEKVRSAWNDLVAAGLKMTGDLAERVATDCLLWPDAATWATWCARWPALPSRLAATVIAPKVGGVALNEPETDEAPPAALADVLAKNPAAQWYRANRDGEHFALVIAPPDPVRWRFYEEAREKKGAAVWALLRELAEAQVLACVQLPDGAPRDVVTLYERWPGFAFFVVAVVSYLAGGAADAELGE